MPVWLVSLGKKIGEKLLIWGGQVLLDYLTDLWRKFKRAAAQKEAEDKLEQVNNDPAKTPDDVGQAYEDYINSGRP